MATADVRLMWQRTASTRVQEDTVREPKLAHCPNLPKPQPEMYHYEMVRGIDQTPSYYRSNTWTCMDTKTMWQMNPSALCDQRPKNLALDDILGSRCLKSVGLQALAAHQTSNVKNSAGPDEMGILFEYATGAELELEWQLIVDPKPKSGLSASFRGAQTRMRNEDLRNINAPVEEKNIVLGGNKNINLQELQMTKSLRELGETCQVEFVPALTSQHQFEDCMEKCQQSRSKSCLYGSTQLLSITHDALPDSTIMSSSISWRTANKETLAALVAQKAKSERLENCDLPTPLSRSVLRGPLESYNDLIANARPDSMESFDRNVMNSMLQVGEIPSLIESLGQSASPNIFERGEPNSSAVQFTRMSLPLTIPTKGQASSALGRRCQSSSFADNRHASWMGGDKGMKSTSLGRSSGPLGKALCHSQTRAREAENRAEESLQDYQKVAHLFFREASLSLTYRQWVNSLQAENARLKMCVHRHQQAAGWLQQSIFSPFSVLDRFTNNRFNVLYGRDDPRRQMHDRFSSLWPAERDMSTSAFVISGEGGAEIIMGCTLSFAFALGLSLAGAGLMLGWSMGWILLAY